MITKSFAQQTMDQWNADHTKHNSTQVIGRKLDRGMKLESAFGAKHFIFSDGSVIKVTGRGRNHKAEIVFDPQALAA